MSAGGDHTRKYKLQTEVVKVSYDDSWHASCPPIYQTATFKNPDVLHMGKYDYTRSGNPTRTILQEHLAKIIGCKQVWVVNSGMSCLDIITRLLKPGDEVVSGDDLYGGTDRLLTYINNNGDIKVGHHDITNLDLMKSKITENTKMVILESPTNPLMKIVDLKSIAEHAHKVNPQCIVVFDNTMMTPLMMKPLELGADIHYESATKYLNGHHDIMAGVLATDNEELADRLFFVINSIGSGLAPFESWLLMRGLKTLALRLERQQSNCIKLANWLESQGFKVRYPGLKSHPQYELHKSQTKGTGAVLSFETGDIDLSERIVRNVDIFGVTVSFGCVNSLISLPCKMSHASIDPKVRAERGFPEDLIRVCVGIEDIDDLIFDLDHAIKQAKKEQKERN
ncbi:homoserine O- acetyltransferase [Brettanomyces nanus]|uniref:Cystathionine beta-lyase n=1 Tax=Eeniella nana TaxID=13502 RepID=A0A875SAE0_EENNA|nr:homoserine O- acetyltransferase [Brettanomyces nanus]QPG75954.1 homoserine O- acetyltransferase [Brettanomyces nanus]